MSHSDSLIEPDTIICGDALEMLRKIPSESIHLAITSPPYNVGIKYSTYEDNLAYELYLQWLKKIWAETKRVLVRGGRLAINIAPTSIADFKPLHYDVAKDVRELGYIMRTEILWYKQTMARRTAWGSWKSPSNPHIIPSWEYVMVFSKDSWKLEGDPRAVDITAEEFKKYSDGFWYISPETRRNGHPAPFPQELIYRIIKYFTYRGNTVLDMFGGTGTVALVAAKTNRHFIQVDISQEYCVTAKRRVDEFLSQEPLYENHLITNVQLRNL
jgi:DNA modification methylase